MRHYILALVLAMTSIGAAIAANPIREGNMISGHVLVKGSEENIPYATILIVGSGQGTVSNEEGQFEFKNLPAGKYKLRVSAVGYKTQEKEIEVNKDFTAVVHFQMEEESFMTDEVVVSANRNEVSRKAAPVVVNVMSTKLFEMVNSTDLAKTLNYQSGLRVENNCQNCGFPQVRINGLEGPYSQILINSRPIISALSGVYGLEQIPVKKSGSGTWRRLGAVRRQCRGRNYQYHYQRPHQQFLPSIEYVLQHGRQVVGAVYGSERFSGSQRQFLRNSPLRKLPQPKPLRP
jgi:outer membrane receptor for ferrienterochelin and colicins